jgi:hypothetical protein
MPSGNAVVLRCAPVGALRCPRWARCLAAGAVVWVTAGVAVAAEPAEVEDLIRKGVELRRDGHDQRALPLFQKAYDLAHTPRTAAQLGLVEMSLGYTLESERHLVEGLASPRDLWIRKNKAVLDSALRRVRASIGELAIDGSPEGAEVWVNGKLAGRLPLSEPVRVPEGAASIELRAPGRNPLSRSVNVGAGKRHQITIALEASAAAAPTTPPALRAEPPAVKVAESAPAAPPVSPPDSAADTPASGPQASSALRPAAWILAAGAVAGVGFGVAETAIWRSRVKDFDNHIGPQPDNPLVTDRTNCGTGDRNHGGTGCAALYDRMQTSRTLAIAGYAVGGAMAIGAAVLFLTSTTPAQETASHAMVCAPWVAVSGTVCGFSF